MGHAEDRRADVPADAEKGTTSSLFAMLKIIEEKYIEFRVGFFIQVSLKGTDCLSKI